MTQPRDQPAPSSAAPSESVNVYTSPEFLGVIAQVYFPGQACQVEDFLLEGQRIRLLTVPGRGPVVRQTFLDMHEALPVPVPTQSERRLRRLRRLPNASLGIVGIDEFRANKSRQSLEGAPTVLWEGFRNWNEYIELLRRRRFLPEDQRRRRRLAEALGPLEFTFDDLRADVMPTCHEWKSLRDRAAGRADLFANQQNRDFFRMMRSTGLLRASSLRAGDRLLAVWLGAVYQQRWSGWVFCFNPDPSMARYSLGRQLLYSMLEASLAAGHRELDFSIGLEQYKLDFATHVRPLADIGSPTLLQRVHTVALPLLKSNPRLYEILRTWRRGRST
jgi:hypothetical protein